ncbi:histone-like protein [Kitasatospora sp. NPDC002040]|uniref:histone-like protein n=1 Tax=Kitasatospora sp. NPDC002040 TaxID=3154661 RepID=UPI0033236EDF
MPTSAPTAPVAGQAAAPLRLSLVQQAVKKKTRLSADKGATVAVATATVYLLGKVVDGAQSAALADGKQKILPRYISRAITGDTDLRAVGANWLVQVVPPPRLPSAGTKTGSAGKKVKNGGDSAADSAHEYGSAVRQVVKARKLQISSNAADALSGIASAYVDELAGLAGELAQQADRKTVTGEDVLGATGILLRGGLKTETDTRIKDALRQQVPAKA